MINIRAYERIGKWVLDQTREDLLSLAKHSESKSSTIGNISIDFVDDLITVEFHHNISKFIGAHISLDPIHKEFAFAAKNYRQVADYFSQFGKEVYVEDETMIVSTNLGISVYFEDEIKEVGVFSTDFIGKMIEGLDPLTT